MFSAQRGREILVSAVAHLHPDLAVLSGQHDQQPATQLDIYACKLMTASIACTD